MDATFALWHPALDPLKQHCYMDVTPLARLHLANGDHLLIERFLARLGIATAPVDWSIEPFCSPYYSSDPRSEDWRDQCPICWRVSVTLAEPTNGLPSPRFFGPHPVDGSDPTWVPQPRNQNHNYRRAIVIADFFTEQWEASSAALSHSVAFRDCHGIKAVPLDAILTQGRFDLGMLTFPAELPRVEALMQACAAVAVSVSWATTLRLAEQLTLGA